MTHACGYNRPRVNSYEYLATTEMELVCEYGACSVNILHCILLLKASLFIRACRRVDD